MYKAPYKYRRDLFFVDEAQKDLCHTVTPYPKVGGVLSHHFFFPHGYAFIIELMATS